MKYKVDFRKSLIDTFGLLKFMLLSLIFIGVLFGADFNPSLLSWFVIYYIAKETKNMLMNTKNKHEDTILHLNELNTAKSRQIERLMKFIAKDYEITMDFDRDLIRETLLKDIRDEDLVNMIMFHVRKGNK